MGGVLVSAEENITKLGIEKSSAKLFSKGAIAIAMYGATIGKTAVFGVEGATNQACAVAIAYPCLDNNYLHYYLKSEKQNFIDKGKGGAQPNISQTVIKQHPIPLSPLNEQKRIVAKLDTLFAHLDGLKAHLERVLVLLKQFRQTVLNKGFSEDWQKVELATISVKIQDGAHHSPGKQYAERKEGTYIYLTSKNIRNNYLDLSNITYVDEEFHKTIYPRCNVEYGDVLLTKDGANTGNVTVNTLREEISLLSSVCLIKTDKKRLLPEFLKFYIQSSVGFNNLTGQMTGTAIKRIILKKIRQAEIPLPPIEEQEKVVRQIEASFARVDAIEQQYQRLKEKVDHLPQAILAKAFRGELVPQDPNDESAELLLERIEKEKVLQKTQKKLKRKPSIAMAKKVYESLVAALEDNKGRLTAKELWQLSPHKDDIDQFYSELKREVEQNKTIRESDDKEYLELT